MPRMLLNQRDFKVNIMKLIHISIYYDFFLIFRYMAQRMGYPMFPPPGVGPLTMPYGGGVGGPGQNVYVTPVQQRPDGVGGMLWSPYDTPVGVTMFFFFILFGVFFEIDI